MFPAWQPAQLPGDILSLWPRAQALPLSRSAPVLWVYPRPQVGPREVREVGKGTLIPGWQSWALCLRHLTPGPWSAPGQTHRRALCLVPALWLTLACPLGSLPKAMTMAHPAEAQRTEESGWPVSVVPPRGWLCWGLCSPVRGVGLAGSFSWAPSPATSNSMKMSRFASCVPFAVNSLESPTSFVYPNQPGPC